MYPRLLFESVQRGVQEGRIPKGRYQHIAIDEGHDFQPEWLELIVRQLSKETESLLLVYDDAQKLYRQEKPQAKKKWGSLLSAGINARGRTSILRNNYRNTQEILKFAYRFAKQGGAFNEDGMDSIPPEAVGRSGSPPELVPLKNVQMELDHIILRCLQFAEDGVPWSEIAVLYRNQNQGQRLATALEQSDVPVEWVNRDAASRNYKPREPSVKLITMHSSKGLEFPVVFIPAVDETRMTAKDEIRLLYVAMTRAIERLIITYKEVTPLVEMFQKAHNVPKNLKDS